MMIKPIEEKHIQAIASLACECFIDDPFYSSIGTNKDQRKELLKEIFVSSIHICMTYGYAYYYELKGTPIAFALWFNYSRIKKQDLEAYKRIFPSEEGNAFYNKIKNEKASIDEQINGSTEYLYLLAIGVANAHRQKGIATQLIEIIKNTFPQFNLFTDISNRKSVKIYQKLGFQVSGEKEDCIFTRYLSPQSQQSLTRKETILLAIPEDFPMSLFIQRQAHFSLTALPHIQTIGNEHSTFKQSLYHSTTAKIISINYDELLSYQRCINILNFQEIYLSIDNKQILVYTSTEDTHKDTGKIYNVQNTHFNEQYEWNIVPDIYISIPIVYQNINKLISIDASLDDFTMNRILKSLNFRTTYEAGIPVEELNNRNFINRISRYYLGKVTIQIQAEREISFNNPIEQAPESIGKPIEVGIIASIDNMTQCGVLHIISLSCGLLTTQLLDSVSRNQINIEVEGHFENLYQYLKRNFDIEKKGSAKSFVTIPKQMEEVRNDLLASMLFCETLYEDGESLGKVVDKEICKKLEAPDGIAQYNYASVFVHTNILIQLSNSLAGSITERIVKESVTLFYIELILFEESAIHIANDKIVIFLTQLNKYSPEKVLKSINAIITSHMRTIEFWDVQMNYPSSKKSVDDIRRAFKLKKEQELIERNKNQLLMIYQIRSGIVDRTEASILSAAGIILTVISVVDIITDSSKSPILSVVALLVGLLLIAKRYIFQKVLNEINA